MSNKVTLLIVLCLFTSLAAVLVSSRTVRDNWAKWPKRIIKTRYTAPLQAPNNPTVIPEVVASSTPMQWGAYVGDGQNDLSNFETLVEHEVNILADFEGWQNDFPSALSAKVGQRGKTLLIFWEPNFGYDAIINGSKDNYINQFATAASNYNDPIILVPFDEMNLNEEDWGYGRNNNTAEKFQQAWRHIHDIFAPVSNVKFGIAYNNVSIPNVSGNRFSDYYPGDDYIDYVGVDGFNFGGPWQNFSQVFDSAIDALQAFNKPIYIFSTASTAGSQKAQWISDGLGSRIHDYQNIAGWIWFNQNGERNWLVNSDQQSLEAFRNIIP